MAIGTYSELQTAVANWLDRDDLTARVPEFISLTEGRIIRKIRHLNMEKRATADTVGGERTIQLPTGYLSMRSLKINRSVVNTLEYMSPSVMYDGSESSGTPRYYTVQGDQLALEPVPDSAYEIEMDYYTFDVLSDSNTTNWLLTDFPDVYLYGSLLQAEAYLVNDARIAIWKAALDEALDEVKKDDKMARWNGTPLVIRVQP